MSALMEMINALYKYRETTEGTFAWGEAVKTVLLLMAPATPHIAEGLWDKRCRGRRRRNDHAGGAGKRQSA